MYSRCQILCEHINQLCWLCNEQKSESLLNKWQSAEWTKQSRKMPPSVLGQLLKHWNSYTFSFQSDNLEHYKIQNKIKFGNSNFNTWPFFQHCISFCVIYQYFKTPVLEVHRPATLISFPGATHLNKMPDLRSQQSPRFYRALLITKLFYAGLLKESDK